LTAIGLGRQYGICGKEKSMRVRNGRLSWSGLVAPAFAALVACASIFGDSAAAATFLVNSVADVPDANPGDGICETAAGNHVCTLRAALQEANKLPGADTIMLQANVTYTLSLTDGTGLYDAADLKVSDSVTITGAGPDSTVIDGNGGATGQAVFLVYQCVGNVYNSQTQTCPNGNVSLSMSGLAIKHGIGPNVAGGIKNYAILTLEHVAITDNRADGINDWGGGIYNAGSLTMTNCLLSNNSTGASNAYGAGMYNQGQLTINDSTIQDNNTPGNGGGLFLIGSPTTIRNTTFSGNSAAQGGAIYHGGYPLHLIGDTLSGNSSGGDGGGLYNYSGTSILINTTLSGNSSGGDGGGVYNENGTTGFYNVTVAQNRANADDSGFASGGGVANAASGTLTLINSIIAGNTLIVPTVPYPTLASDDCGGTLTSQGYNILANVGSDCSVGGPYALTDPALGTLQFNGGLTRTHAIAPGSPAVDAGNPGGCTDDLGAPLANDQRGVHRPYGSHCDIGAFEYADIIFRNGFNP